MQYRLLARRFETHLLEHALAVDARPGGLQRPRGVRDVAAMHPAGAVGAVEAVALGEEVVERPRSGGEYGAGRTIARGEFSGGRVSVSARALIIHPAAVAL